MRKIVRSLLPIFVLLLFLITFFLVANFYFPNPDILFDTLKKYFSDYGYPVLVISAIIESIPLINIYFPGSSIILLAAAFSRQGSLNIYAVIALTMIAFTATYALNYYIGRSGWYYLFCKCGMEGAIDKSKSQIKKHGSWWIWISYIHPNLGALTSTAFGILKLDFGKFLIQSALANTFWAIFWGLLMYYSSDQVLGILTARWLMIAVIVVFILVKILVEYFRQKSENCNR